MIFDSTKNYLSLPTIAKLTVIAQMVVAHANLYAQERFCSLIPSGTSATDAFSERYGANYNAVIDAAKKGQENGDCGTILCFAGWYACLFETPEQYLAIVKAGVQQGGFEDNTFLINARNGLGLDRRQARALFGHPDEWPYEFKIRYNKAKTPKGRAKAGHDRIMAFIKEYTAPKVRKSKKTEV